MARVLLNVPDIIYERMEKYKHSFDYSKVFQNAVEEVLDRREKFILSLSIDVDMETIANRYLEEEKNDHTEKEIQGNRDAVNWIKNASRKEIDRALKIIEVYGGGNITAIFNDPILGDYFEMMCKKYSFKEASDEMMNWVTGWWDGFQNAWSEIEEIIKEMRNI